MSKDMSQSMNENTEEDLPLPNLIWIDLEMTGLDPNKERIIEIATIVTDGELNEIAAGPNLIVHQTRALLDAMDDWNSKQHGKSGLTEAVRESAITESDAERQTLEFLKRHAEKGKSPICGNSVQTDRRFLRRFMPDLDAFMHYRQIDVSSIKELAKRWAPTIYQSFDKNTKDAHRALEDIRQSIAELKHYREHFMTKEND
ncbi:MAG: oligoribonuclease [Gammaproteobacteria bacterium]|nr:oligoribonuclease [Gammaproteobacteria bacterium]